MGTTYQIRVIAQPEQLQQLADLVEQELLVVNQQMSTYLPDSEISTFNSFGKTQVWFEVSVETARVVQKAIEISKATNGAFDVTVGPLVNLWGFGPDGLPDRIPSDEEIARVAHSIGYGLVASRSKNDFALMKKQPDASVDLSAIAKRTWGGPSG